MGLACLGGGCPGKDWDGFTGESLNGWVGVCRTRGAGRGG